MTRRRNARSAVWFMGHSVIPCARRSRHRWSPIVEIGARRLRYDRNHTTAAATAASKAGLKVMMDWRLVFGRQGMRFTTICPGFTESEMTAQDVFAPARILPAAKAASLIARA